MSGFLDQHYITQLQKMMSIEHSSDTNGRVQCAGFDRHFNPCRQKIYCPERFCREHKWQEKHLM